MTRERGDREPIDRCDYCDAALDGAPFDVEVYRDRPDDGSGENPDTVSVSFCGEAHAGLFFSERRLPAVRALGSANVPLTFLELLGMAGCLLVVLVVAALLAARAWHVFDWILN